jgi:hypothetical protein
MTDKPFFPAHHNQAVTLPPGSYYIGDPCYLGTDDEEWEDKAARTVALFSTCCGDGLFPDLTSEDKYGVDAAHIGAIPVAEDFMLPENLAGIVQVVEFADPVVCHRELDGELLIFGHIVIDTNPAVPDDDRASLN